MSNSLNKKTTTSTTRSKTKKVEKPIEKAESKEIIDNIIDETNDITTKEPKEFKENDLILCRSVTGGIMTYIGQQSEIVYKWTGIGATTRIRYCDLEAAMISGSQYLLDPLFVIDNEDVLEIDTFSELKDLYSSLYTNIDIDKLLSLPVVKFRAELEKAPLGLKNAIKSKVASLIDSGEFDSIKKIEIIDELCGTDFKCVI